MHNLPNLLLIAGNGRNSGKTTLACAIIKKFSSQQSLIGLKISPHVHNSNRATFPVFNNGLFKIFRETELTSGKDSSKMLSAGASQAFYIETSDKFLSNAFQEFQKLIPSGTAIVCESPALRKYIVPGIFLFLCRQQTLMPKNNQAKIISLADKVFDLDKALNSMFLSTLLFENFRWLILKDNR
jgi:hypothetical protein